MPQKLSLNKKGRVELVDKKGNIRAFHPVDAREILACDNTQYSLVGENPPPVKEIKPARKKPAKKKAKTGNK